MPKLHHVVDSRNKMSTALARMLPMAVSSKINCITIGSVVKYDHSNHTCNVQPLAKQSDGTKRPIYNYCIVPYSIWMIDKIMKPLTKKNRQYSITGGMGGTVEMTDIPKWKPLQHGSIVVIGACDREIDNLNLKTGKPYKIGTSRMHSFNDSIVLGVIKP